MDKTEREENIKGIAHIYTSYNNTIIHITDMAGNTIARVSGGQVTKHDRLKATPTVAMFAAKRAAEKASEQGIKEIYIKIKAKPGQTAGPGESAAIRGLAKSGLRVLNISDITAIPRGGPKQKHGRRGRRP